MKKSTVFLLLAISLMLYGAGNIFAQDISNYTFNYSPTGGNFLTPFNYDGKFFPTAGADNQASPVASIGFDFWFMGQKYDQFSVDENGLLRLGSTVITPENVNDFSSSVNAPIIAGYWDDLLVQAVNTNGYTIDASGGVGNRSLRIFWYGHAQGSSQARYWQVVLYESNNSIEFRYPYNYWPTTSGYSIGIGNSTTAFQNVQMSATPTAVVNSAVNDNLMAIPQNSMMTFTPSQPLAPTNLVFSNVTATGVDLTWTDTNSDEIAYVVEKSTDGINYSLVAQLPANSTTTSVSGLSSGLYTFKVSAIGVVPGPGLTGSQGINIVPLASLIKIGPSGSFASISDAIAALKSNGVVAGGSVFELEAAYNSSAEAFPLDFSNLPTSAADSLVIRPETGAAGLEITSSAAQTINMNGAQYVIFDGRPGGIGTVSQLKIDNTSATGNALLLQNASSNNTMRYCEFTGITTGTANSSGVVVIGTSTAALGNSNNLFEYCSIHDGASKPTILMTNSGTNSKLNQNNTISNCNFYDWNLATGTGNARAIYLAANQSGTLISGNSFYLTNPTGNITQTTNSFVHIYGDGTTFENNYLGGSGPECSGTMTLNYSSYYGKVFGLYLQAGAITPTEIQGNVIQNIQMNIPAGSGGYFSGIEILAGKVNIGTTTGNLIGSETVSNSILINNLGTWYASGFVGINENNTGYAADYVNISNNTICGISYPNAASFPITGISIKESYSYAAPAVVSNNTIGSTTLTDAISSDGAGSIIGISAATGAGSNITGNTIANISKTFFGATGQLIGILTTSDNVNNNTIFNLANASGTAATGSTTSLIGISVNGIDGTTVSGNHVYGLTNTNSSAAATVTGIYAQASTTGPAIIEKNLIHGLDLASSDPTAGITGIYAYTGKTEIQNNMIRLGIDDAGAGIITGYAITGIYNASTTNALYSNNFYHNNVYIGGTGVSGETSNTFAFNSTVLSNATNIQNNILVNARSGGATGKHYAISVAGTSPIPAGVTSNSNILYAPGVTGGNIGLYNGAGQLTLGAWQAASGLDALSATTDPLFVNPTGNGAALDLHVQATNPIEGSGVLIASVTDDFDGETRSGLTPTDIGADAGNFTSSGDLFAPALLFTPLPNTASTANATLSVEITDGVGVSTGANQPRLYFKKVSDADAFAGNTSSDNGWKYVHPENTSSPYNFTMDFSIINGGSVSPGDVIQYFVVAQDDADNYASNASGVIAATPNPVQNITTAPALANVNSYLILSNFSGTYTIPGNYQTLTGNNGLFDAINQGTVIGNISIQITDNLVEPGTVALNEFASPFTMAIVPASASLKTITGNIDNGLIRFNGADRVTIDGRFAGTGQYLEFSNTSIGSSSLNSAFLFVNAATYDTLKYLAINSQGPSGAIIKFNGINPYSGACSFNVIDHCNISNPGSGNVPSGIYSYSNVGGSNVSNSITNCNISNFSNSGINLATGNSDWTISGNSLYQTSAITSTGIYGIIISGPNGSDFIVTDNFIGGSAPNAGGAPWTITSSTGAFYGMYFLTNNTTPAFNATVTNNTITNLDLTSTGYYGFYGMYLSSYNNSGLFTMTGNTIGSSSITDAIVLKGTSTANYGINKGGNYQSLNFSNNTIGGITASRSFTGIYMSATTPGVHTINGNTIGSPVVANSIKMGDAAAAVNFTGIYNYSSVASSISNNTIANITNLYEGTLTGDFIKGLYLNGTGAASVNGNTIFNLTTNSAQAGTLTTASVIGIYDNSSGANKTISKNMISNLSNTSGNEAVNILGVYTSAGSAVYSNNVINLGLDTTGAPMTTGYPIYGIYNAGGSNTYYFNTINIQGSGVSGTAASTYALYCNSATGSIADNVFVNTRSGGTGGLNYTVRLTSMPGTLNYNDYYVASGTDFLAALGTTDYTDFTSWKGLTFPPADDNSLNADPLFASSANLYPTNGALAAGTPLGGITTDYLGTTRATPPTIGAYESVIITISGNAGIANAVISWFDGTANSVTADGSGAYSFDVSYNWSGVVTPSLTGYAFTPANRVYTNLLADSIDQNYAASQLPASVVGYWNLNETAGNTFSDLTGVNNGTGNVSPAPSAGQVSGAQLFDGSTTKIEVPANPSLDFLSC